MSEAIVSKAKAVRCPSCGMCGKLGYICRRCKFPLTADEHIGIPPSMAELTVGNRPITASRFREEVLKRIVQEHGSQIATAAMLQISPQYLSDILSGRREITNKIARKLGWVRETTFRYQP